MSQTLSSPAVRIHAIGGPEVMQLESVDVPAPGPQQIRIQQSAVGINYIDVYHRTGVYPIGLPAIIGSEAVGVVESVGSAVHDLHVGQRVTYAPVIGAYAQYRNLNADRAILVPDGLRAVSNVVLMGMGEPLYNFENVRDAMEVVTDGDGLSLSRRRITL
jgi:NADPH2:quinone reductase